MDNITFGVQTPWYKRLELHRHNLDMTQQQLADEIGVPSRTLQRWEKGENVPTPQLQRRIAEVVHVDPETLFGNEPKKRSEYRPGHKS